MTPHLSRRERLLARLREIGDAGLDNAPKRSLGQNFLVSDHVVDRILMAAKSLPFSGLVEVGPGLGAITEDLLTLGHPMTVIELDRRFAQAWRERAAAGAPMTVVEADALQVDWRELNLKPDTLFVSNLPYQISSSLVIERSLEPAGVTRMVLMFQKEVAQRITAQAGSKEYGLLTVVAQTFWETQKVCEASPQDFFPAPNVASRVLMFKRRTKGLEWLEEGRGTSQGLLAFAKAAYSHRRKLLWRNLAGVWGPLNGREGVLPQIEAIFAKQGLKPTARAEELDPQAFVRLYLAMEEEFRRGAK